MKYRKYAYNDISNLSLHEYRWIHLVCYLIQRQFWMFALDHKEVIK